MEPSRSWKPRAKLWVNIFLDVWLHKNTKNTHIYKNNYKQKYEDEIWKVSGLGGGHHPPSTSCPTPARSVSTSRSRSASSSRPLSLSSLPSTSSLSKHLKGQLWPRVSNEKWSLSHSVPWRSVVTPRYNVSNEKWARFLVGLHSFSS